MLHLAALIFCGSLLAQAFRGWCERACCLRKESIQAMLRLDWALPSLVLQRHCSWSHVAEGVHLKAPLRTFVGLGKFSIFTICTCSWAERGGNHVCLWGMYYELGKCPRMQLLNARLPVDSSCTRSKGEASS